MVWPSAKILETLDSTAWRSSSCAPNRGEALGDLEATLKVEDTTTIKFRHDQSMYIYSHHAMVQDIIQAATNGDFFKSCPSLRLRLFGTNATTHRAVAGFFQPKSLVIYNMYI